MYHLASWHLQSNSRLHSARLPRSWFSLEAQESLLDPGPPSPEYSTRKLWRPWMSEMLEIPGDSPSTDGGVEALEDL